MLMHAAHSSNITKLEKRKHWSWLHPLNESRAMERTNRLERRQTMFVHSDEGKTNDDGKRAHVDEVRRLGFIDSRAVERWKDESMRMKTDDVVRSFFRSSGSIVYRARKGG
jgi:hypothetical protein